LGAPLFRKVTLNLENGKKVIISAPNNNKTNRYIKEMTWNGQDYTKNWIRHSDLQQGANLNFQMSETPNKERGTKTEDFPYSLSTDTIYLYWGAIESHLLPLF